MSGLASNAPALAVVGRRAAARSRWLLKADDDDERNDSICLHRASAGAALATAAPASTWGGRLRQSSDLAANMRRRKRRRHDARRAQTRPPTNDSARQRTANTRSLNARPLHLVDLNARQTVSVNIIIAFAPPLPIFRARHTHLSVCPSLVLSVCLPLCLAVWCLWRTRGPVWSSLCGLD